MGRCQGGSGGGGVWPSSWRLLFRDLSQGLHPARRGARANPIGSSQEQVLLVLGTPSTVATVNGEAYYYISQQAVRPIGFMPTQMTDQRVVAVYFDKKKRVERLADYALKDGRVFDFVSRTTPTGGKDTGFVVGLFKIF